MLNSVQIEGNLTRNPELAYTPNQKAVCKFGIACNNKYGEKEDVVFIDCEAWGKQAENINKYFTKGKRILLEASLKLDQWEKDGHKHSRMKLSVNRFHFPPKGESQSSDNDEPAAEHFPDEIPF